MRSTELRRKTIWI